ncbi:MAG: Rieske 2Fe-2S domain-containing protein [Chloroflexota bacterium]|nr:Rieske 2Fe-2S domain-containing protein [Chloroflexota bacterium]
MSQLGYGPVHGQPIGEITRRGFMRRMIGWGVGLLSLEFLGGTFAFLWPNLKGGLGGDIEVGTAKDIVGIFPDWAKGQPYSYPQGRLFLVNIPAGEDLVDGKPANVADPKDKVLALYRKCPHLGCNIPPLCDKSHWFECLCHGSKYNILGEKRAGPAPRGMDRFPVTVGGNGVYVVKTGQKINGPPIGTATFDNRDTAKIPHCAS